MQIQLIDKQKGKYTLLIHDIECVFMPMQLFVPKNKSVIKWKVGDKQISYNQIKKAIKQTLFTNKK
jgi:hypothetical protein